jgi:hypothetical protein
MHVLNAPYRLLNAARISSKSSLQLRAIRLVSRLRFEKLLELT